MSRRCTMSDKPSHHILTNNLICVSCADIVISGRAVGLIKHGEEQ